MTIKPPSRRSLTRSAQQWGARVSWLAYFVLLVIHCIENTALTYTDAAWLPALYLVRNLMYLVLLAKIAALSIYRTKELWWILGALLAALLCFLCSDDFVPMEFAIIAIAAKDIAPKKLLKLLLLVKAVAIVVTLLLSGLDLLPSLTYDGPFEGTLYQTMGFCHRNVLGANMTVLCLGWLYLRYRELSLLDVALWVLLSFVTYLLAISRSSLIIMLLSIAAVCLFRLYEKKLAKFPYLQHLLIGAIFVMFAISFICTIYYDKNSDFWVMMDKFFTRRLQFAHQCYIQYGVTLFGQEMPFVSTMGAELTGEKRLILDNAYMYLLVHDGILICGLFLTLASITISQAFRRRDRALAICFLVIGIYGMSERYILDVFYDFPLLLGIIALFRKPTGKDISHPIPYAWLILQRCWVQIKIGWAWLKSLPEEKP